MLILFMSSILVGFHQITQTYSSREFSSLISCSCTTGLLRSSINLWPCHSTLAVQTNCQLPRLPHPPWKSWTGRLLLTTQCLPEEQTTIQLTTLPWFPHTSTSAALQRGPRKTYEENLTTKTGSQNLELFTILWSSTPTRTPSLKSPSVCGEES